MKNLYRISCSKRYHCYHLSIVRPNRIQCKIESSYTSASTWPLCFKRKVLSFRQNFNLQPKLLVRTPPPPLTPNAEWFPKCSSIARQTTFSWHGTRQQSHAQYTSPSSPRVSPLLLLLLLLAVTDQIHSLSSGHQRPPATPQCSTYFYARLHPAVKT